MKLTKARFHFVGIGGIGMCGLAELLHNMGAFVQGSDLSVNTQTKYLQEIGVRIFQGHEKKFIKNIDVVVYSSAVKESNAEIVEAQKQGISVIPRAEALAEIMRSKRGIAIAGTHGKTTTTSIMASIFLQAETDPTIVVGGRLDLIKSTAMLGQGEWIIAEADESDGSFSKLTPEIAVVTNIDVDHLDHYKSFQNLQKAFYEFTLKVPFYGLAIVCGDDHRVRELFKEFPKKMLFYGFEKENDFYIKGEKGKYEVYRSHSGGLKKSLGFFLVSLPGRHNALNALAAIVCGLSSGISFETCIEGVGKFTGVGRRFEFRGEEKGVLFYDDYAHHPTEIRATLQGFKEKFSNSKRLVVMFQPHRYTRTQNMWHEFTQCFELADQVIVTDIYPGAETPIDGVTGKMLSEAISHPDVCYIPRDHVLIESQKIIKEGDVYLTLGAGDGWKFGAELKSCLKKS